MKGSNKAMLRNIVGKKFNRLTVLERLPNKISTNGSTQRLWKCRCDCGSICEKTTYSVTHTISCGCRQKEVVKSLVQKIFTGCRFGFLTVLSFERDSSGTSAWRCKCFCGNECVVRSRRLRQSLTKSCGCMSTALRNETYYKNHPFNPADVILKQTHQQFRKYLSLENTRNLMLSPCVYCGLKADASILKFNTIDISDDPPNTACYLCKNAMDKMPKKSFLEWLNRIALKGQL